MKKILLGLFVAAMSLQGMAQITLNRSDFAVANDWYLLATDTVISANTATALRVSGANQTWDIAGWAHRHSKDTTFYADGFTYPTAPAGCTLVSFTRDPNTGEESPSYLMVNNSALRVIMEAGTTTGSGGALKVFQFPSTMGTSFKDSVESFYAMLASDMGLNIPLVDSIRIIYKIKMNSVIDAWGKLKMDAGTFDVLRQKMVNTVIISFKIRNIITGTWSDIPQGLGMGEINESNTSYTWVGANGGHPLLQMNEDTAGVVTDMEFMLASSKGLSSGLHKLNGQNTVAKVFPVPASDKLTIEYQTNANANAQLSVFDILGNEVMPAIQVEVNKGLNQLPLSVENLKPGVYFYSLEGNGIHSTGRFSVK